MQAIAQEHAIGGDELKDRGDWVSGEIELAVEEDRAGLALQAVGMLALNVALLFCAVGAWTAANVTGNVLFLIAVLAILTAVWFVSKGMGRRLNRLVTGVHVIDFRADGIVLFEKSNPRDARVIRYKDVSSYKCIRQGRTLRLLLAGDWVRHPSGYQLVSIARPLHPAELDGIQVAVTTAMGSHHVRELA